MPPTVNMLELMHHDYFKRPELTGAESTPAPVLQTPKTELGSSKVEDLSEWAPSEPYVLTCASADNIYQTPDPSRLSDENSRSPVCRKRAHSSSPPPGSQRRGQVRSSSLKPIRLSKVFSMSEAAADAGEPKSAKFNGLCVNGSVIKRKRTSRSYRNRDKDYLREYQNEEELRRKFRGISYHIFDEAEVLQAIAEAQALDAELVPRSSDGVQATSQSADVSEKSEQTSSRDDPLSPTKGISSEGLVVSHPDKKTVALEPRSEN